MWGGYVVVVAAAIMGGDIAADTAALRGGYYGGYWGPRYWGPYWGAGWGWGGAYWGAGYGGWGPGWGYWGAPVYGSAPVVMVQEPNVWVESEQAAATTPLPAPQAPSTNPNTQQWWYWCSSTRGYYPYVSSCAEGWQRVAPQPVPAAK